MDIQSAMDSIQESMENALFPNFDLKILENKIAANELIDVRKKIEHIIFIAQNQEKF